MGKLHRIGSSSLGHGSQVRGITEQLCQRHAGVDSLRRRPGFHAQYFAAPRTNITDHITHKVIRYHLFYGHDGYEENRISLSRSLLESHRTGNLESDLGRVRVMIGTLEKRRFNVHNGVTREGAVFGRFLNSFFNGGNIFPRNRTALDRIDEFETSARLLRFEGNPNIAVLTASTGLANEAPLLFDFLADGFLIRDLWLADVGANVELP